MILREAELVTLFNDYQNVSKEDFLALAFSLATKFNGVDDTQKAVNLLREESEKLHKEGALSRPLLSAFQGHQSNTHPDRNAPQALEDLKCISCNTSPFYHVKNTKTAWCIKCDGYTPKHCQNCEDELVYIHIIEHGNNDCHHCGTVKGRTIGEAIDQWNNRNHPDWNEY